MPHTVRGRKIKKAGIRPAGKETAGNKAEVEKTEAVLVVEEKKVDEIELKWADPAGDKTFWPETLDELDAAPVEDPVKTAAEVPGTDRKKPEEENAGAEKPGTDGIEPEKVNISPESAEADTEKPEQQKKKVRKRSLRKLHGGKRRKHLTRKKIIRQIRMLLVLLIIISGITVFLAYRHYRLYPGAVIRSSIRASDRGTDFIEITWKKVRNVDKYTVFYKPYEKEKELKKKKKEPDRSWKAEEVSQEYARLEGLEEGTTYSFIIRADSAERDGFPTEKRNFTTQRHQKIVIDEELVKFTISEPFKIEAKAETDMTFESSNPDVAEVDGDSGLVKIKDEGTSEITITARETKEFTEARKTVLIRAFDIDPVTASGASPRTVFHLDADNCEAVKAVSGTGGAVVPQGMAYDGKQYYVAFGMYGPTRIVKYGADGGSREVEVPDISLGHPNGLTYNDQNGWCYCVRGNSSTCVIYDTRNDSYSSKRMPVGCSGIGYDSERKLLYTSARGSLVVYDPDSYEVLRRFRRVSRGSTEYMQDSVACDGLLLNCVSGRGKSGINYIDIYDMVNSRYIGTFICDLGELESAIVNNDGHLEILSNSSGNTNYIWRTDINIRKFAEEVQKTK